MKHLILLLYLKIQEIKADEGSPLAEYINTINNCYPEEIVKYILFSKEKALEILDFWEAKKEINQTNVTFHDEGYSSLSNQSQ